MAYSDARFAPHSRMRRG